MNRNGNFVKKLPSSVTQIKCDTSYCGATFNLGPADSATDSCILKVTIKGSVAGGKLTACTASGSNCDSVNALLTVVEGASLPFIGIAAGVYSNNAAEFFPLLVTTNTSGGTWFYPPEIFKNLKTSIDPSFFSGLRQGAACSGLFTKGICIAAGNWCSDSSCTNQFPLVAVGTNMGTTWSYPHSIFQNLHTIIDPNFVSGSFDREAATHYSDQEQTSLGLNIF